MIAPSARSRVWLLEPSASLQTAGYVVIALYALVLAVILRPVILVDDAAITFRHAERIAAGKGFTYNDHEHVFGASNPLYTIVLAVLVRSGANVETAARTLALLVFEGSVLLGMLVAQRLSNWWGGLLAGFALASNPFFRYWALSGMESGLATLLGLLLVLAILYERQTLVAIFLGLAVWNKLDGSLVALGFAIAWIVVYRTLPIRTAVISLLIALPWFAFAWIRFGSPIPHSMVTKLANNSGIPPDGSWPAQFVYNQGFLPLVCVSLVLFLPPVWRVMTASQRVAMTTLAAWFGLHFAALSFVWLGDYYPWYLTVLCVPPIILASAATGRLLTSNPAGKPVWLAGLLGVAAIVHTSAHRPWHFHTLEPSEAFDFDRRAAGMFLAQYADPSEVVASGFGWVAYEIPNPFNDYTGLSSNQLLHPEAYWVLHGLPYQTGAHPPSGRDGYIPLASFNLASDVAPGFSWFTVFGRPDSKVAQSGKRFLQLRLFELPPPTAYSDAYGLHDVHIAETDLQAHPPSGATFAVENNRQLVHFVFTPAFVPNVPVDKTDGVTFKIMVNGQLEYQQHVRPTDSVDPVVLPLYSALEADTLAVSFVTDPGPHGNRDYDWAVWRSVKIVVGDAYVNLGRHIDERLVHEWARHNPVSTGR